MPTSPNAVTHSTRAARYAMRAVCLAVYAMSVLDNAFGWLTYEDSEASFQRCDEALAEFACWPFENRLYFFRYTLTVDSKLSPYLI